MKALNTQIVQDKLRNKFLKLGAKMSGPETIFFSSDTKIGKNVTIEPYVVIGKKVKIGNNVIIKSFSHLESCKIENKVEVGPYARIRPDTILKEGSKVGNFVEILDGDLNKTIMIGDSETDANAAKAAEIPVILLENGYTEKNTTEIYHNHLIKDYVGIEKIISKYL